MLDFALILIFFALIISCSCIVFHDHKILQNNDIIIKILFGLSIVLFIIGIVTLGIDKENIVKNMESKTGCTYVQRDSKIAYMECVGGVIKMFKIERD